MIAFTGAMTTENMGYGSWSDLSESYLLICRKLIKANPYFSKKAQIETALSSIESAMKEDKSYDKRVAFSIAREALRQADEANRCHRQLRLEEFRNGFNAQSLSGLTDLRARLVEQAKRFVEDFSLESILGCAVATLFHFRLNTASGPVTARELLRQLGIKRFATLSYDLELEDAIMTERGALEAFDTHDPYNNLITAIHNGQIRCDEDIPSRWQALLHNGRHVESNILLRERPDLLVEFATGSTRLTQHIMHMHGRACTPDSMIVGLRDYDSLYRKTDISTLPFEHARQLLFTGNPLLFLGLGMSETEVNATLQTYVSNNPYRYLTPNFLLWNSHGFPEDPVKRAAMMFAKRVAWLQSLGVMVIFDEDLDDAEIGKKIAEVRTLKSNVNMAHVIVGLDTKTQTNLAKILPDAAASRTAEVNLLPATVESLAKRVAHIWATSATHSSDPDDVRWRSMRPRFERSKLRKRNDRTYRLWSRENYEGGQVNLPPPP